MIHTPWLRLALSARMVAGRAVVTIDVSTRIYKEADKKGPQGAPGLLLSDDVPVSVPGKVFDMGNGRLLRRQGVS